jgi:hypothetical protein
MSTSTARRLSILLCLASLSFASSLAAGPKAAELSDALKAPRPKGGEHFGLYLLNRKVGYAFNDLSISPGTTDKAKAVSEFFFRANVGDRVSERLHTEVRLYEAKPGGRLLSFTIEDKGDGGNQRLEGEARPEGIRVVRKRPGQAVETLNLPSSQETIEDADQPRVAVLRNQPMVGSVLDGQDLESYKMTTTVKPSEQRLVRGVIVSLHKVVSISDKEKVPTEILLSQNGEMVELSISGSMKMVSEPAAVAKRLDKVEVFGLTRIVLPKAMPEKVNAVPAAVSLVLAGLPEKFWRDSNRQRFSRLSEGQVQVTISAAPPKYEKPLTLPVADPNGGEYLKSSLVMESASPEIQRQAKKILGDEKDAYQATKKIVAWVSSHMKKEYGSSADRATDVLHQMRGDCTEHSLLSVALLRAAGIPARRVDGVVYMESTDRVPALYWHEWVEAYVGEWTQLDPTFGETVAHATHFALGEESGAEITPLIGQLKVLDVR